MQATARTTRNQSHPNNNATNPSPLNFPSSPKCQSLGENLVLKARITTEPHHFMPRFYCAHHADSCTPWQCLAARTTRDTTTFGSRNSAGLLHFSARWTRCGQGILSGVPSPAGRVESEALPRTLLYFASPSSVAARIAEGTRTRRSDKHIKAAPGKACRDRKRGARATHRRRTFLISNGWTRFLSIPFYFESLSEKIRRSPFCTAVLPVGLIFENTVQNMQVTST